MSIWTQKRTVVAYALSLLSLAEIVDLTIVSVAIPDLMGALGANINDIALTMTSYIVAAAICIPLTGLVTSKYGTRTVALTSIIVFGISSILCGTATRLQQMIIYRLIQGIGGAFLPSLAQSYVVEKFTKDEQAKVMTVITICIVLGPIIGPIMGGYIVQNLSWRWIFYVNVPICTLGFMLIAALMDKEPVKTIKIDYISFLFMATGIGCLEYFVDEGNSHNWFDSFAMVSFLVAAIIALGFFIWRGLLGKSVVNFNIFKNTNFVLSCGVMFCFFSLLSGGLSYFSAMLQNVYGMPVDVAGLLQIPRGIAAVLGAPIYIQLSKKYDPRYLMTFAMLLTGCSTMGMGTLGTVPHFGLIIMLVVLQGFGMIGFFVLLMSVAYTGVPTDLSYASAGVFNFARNFSSSIGAALGATIIANQQQTVWHDLAAHISHMSIGFMNWSASLHILSPNLQLNLAAMLIRQAAILQSYLDMFHAAGLTMALLCWLPFLLQKPDRTIKIALGH